jgi:multiple sugar transport system ATP-binding protein
LGLFFDQLLIKAAMASLRIENVHKRFGATHVLKGINLAIEQGEFLILVGPSGCGKSTLLSMIAGLDDISEGQIKIGEQVVNDVSPKDRDIAMVFQSYALYPSMTVRQNIEFGLRMKKVPAPERAETVARVSKMLQIDPLLDRRPAQLSGGQRQRVAMGRALARNPEIFLFDEPLSNLDAKLRVEMRAEIKALHQRLKTTIVYVTHDQVEAMTLGDRIAVMKDGEVQQFGTPADIYERPANQYVASFIGSPTMNFLPAVQRGAEVSVQPTAAGADQSHTAAHAAPAVFALPAAAAAQAERAVTLGIRPENFEAVPAQTPGSVPIQIDFLEPTGADTFASARLGAHRINVRFAPKAAPTAGDTVWVRVDAASINLFDVNTQKRLAA